MTNQATLVGKRLSSPLFEDLKVLLNKSYNQVSAWKPRLEILEATATVNGKNITASDKDATASGKVAPDAYLSVELLFKGHEWSPCILEFPLKGSKKFEATDKSYVKILSDYVSCDHAIRTFFRAYAKTLEYRGNGMAAEDCVKSDIQPDVQPSN